MRTTNICIWGDSIVHGAWDREGGWADRLRRFLHNKTIRSNFKDYYWVYNLGIPGETSEDVLRRFAVERDARQPHVAVFAFGTNDSRRATPEGKSTVDIERFCDNVAVFIREARETGARCFILGIGSIDEALTSPFDGHSYFFQNELDKYNAKLEKFAEEADVPFISLRGIVGKTDLIDGLHPNDNGHEKIFERVKLVLEEQGVIV